MGESDLTLSMINDVDVDVDVDVDDDEVKVVACEEESTGWFRELCERSARGVVMMLMLMSEMMMMVSEMMMIMSEMWRRITLGLYCSIMLLFYSLTFL